MRIFFQKISGRFAKRQILLYLLCFLVVYQIAGCKKEPKSNTQQNNTTTQNDHYTSKINGSWIGIGTGQDVSTGRSGDVFFQFQLTKLDTSEIIGINRDTLKYRSTDSNTHTVVFTGYLRTVYNAFYSDSIIYNYSNNTIIAFFGNIVYFTWNQAGEYLQVTASPSTYDPSLKDYISNIAGTKIVSGYAYDTVSIKSPPDSLYSLAGNIELSIVDDSTLKYNKNFTFITDSLLHFKTMDKNSKTIIFQTYHEVAPDGGYTTLTYNYMNNTLVFEQWYWSDGIGVEHVLLQ